jgi:hypothetical protein
LIFKELAVSGATTNQDQSSAKKRDYRAFFKPCQEQGLCRFACLL